MFGRVVRGRRSHRPYDPRRARARGGVCLAERRAAREQREVLRRELVLDLGEHHDRPIDRWIVPRKPRSTDRSMNRSAQTTIDRSIDGSFRVCSVHETEPRRLVVSVSRDGRGRHRAGAACAVVSRSAVARSASLAPKVARVRWLVRSFVRSFSPERPGSTGRRRARGRRRRRAAAAPGAPGGGEKKHAHGGFTMPARGGCVFMEWYIHRAPHSARAKPRCDDDER